MNLENKVSFFWAIRARRSRPFAPPVGLLQKYPYPLRPKTSEQCLRRDAWHFPIAARLPLSAPFFLQRIGHKVPTAIRPHDNRVCFLATAQETSPVQQGYSTLPTWSPRNPLRHCRNHHRSQRLLLPCLSFCLPSITWSRRDQ